MALLAPSDRKYVYESCSARSTILKYPLQRQQFIINVSCLSMWYTLWKILTSQRSWIKTQVNFKPSSDVTMKGGIFIVTNMTRLTSALVWVVMGTTCLESVMFLYIRKARPISVLLVWKKKK
jgi:hypothetical protein